ncbi:MAG TPA: hypothetical protein P5136_06385 [Methanofastidiosum sp.]|nr:hypothetical protein [Methanofastidiosum sp.]
MKLTKEILKELGYLYSKSEKLFYSKANPHCYMYEENIKFLTLKEYVDNEIRSAYEAGYKAAQRNIRKAIGLTV